MHNSQLASARQPHDRLLTRLAANQLPPQGFSRLQPRPQGAQGEARLPRRVESGHLPTVKEGDEDGHSPHRIISITSVIIIVVVSTTTNGANKKT